MRFQIPTYLAFAVMAQASSLVPLTEEQEFQAAEAVCRGKVTAVRTIADAKGQPVTRAWIAVEETFRGRLPATICVESKGGDLPGISVNRGDFVPLRPEEERIFNLSKSANGFMINRGTSGASKVLRQASGELSLDEFLRQRRLRRGAAGGRDFTEVVAPPVSGTASAENNGAGGSTSAGLLTDNGGIPARWTAPDRGEPIPVLVDDSLAPAGVTETVWRTALTNAFAAWTAATGVTFRIEGTAVFGDAADFIDIDDEKIRIQLHDAFNAINGAGVLGLGGRESSSVYGEYNTTGGMGGQINGLEFHKVVRGYVILEHSATALQNPKTLEEVLSHELGHVLGLGHSSENLSETDTVKKDALMYFRAHLDGRGASLRTYDVPMVQKVHPLQNPPPWSSNRYMSVITHSVIPNTPGVNEVTLGTYTRPGNPPAALSVVAGAASTLNGSFNLAPGGQTFKLRYVPSARHGSSTLDPANEVFRDFYWYRIANPQSCSPWYRVAVSAFARDTQPITATDGIPDTWMFTYFGSANPANGTNRGAAQDFDKDGLTNLEEYELGTDPTSASSFFQARFAPGQLQWTCRPWTTYELEGSDNLQSWRILRTIHPPGSIEQSPVPTITASIPFVPGASGAPRFVRIRQRR